MNSSSNQESSESLKEVLLGGNSGKTFRKMVVGSLVAIILPLILLTPIERRSFIGLDSPCSYTSYSFAGLDYESQCKNYPLSVAYQRLVGPPPECNNAILVGAQDLYLLPFVATLYSMGGSPVAMSHEFFASMASTENTRMSEAAKKQMLLDAFSLSARDDSGHFHIQYADKLRERIVANGSAKLEVSDLPEVSTISSAILYQ